jgi:hypothetical protein
MWIQPISHRGRVVACATATRVLLAAELERRRARDPELRFVLLMCHYARDILTGVLSGPYCDDDARAYARAALIPEDLLERSLLDPARTCYALGVPLCELLAARREYRARQAARP